MGCISSKKQVEEICPNIFQVINVDEHGNELSSGQLELTDRDLVLYQRGRSPIKWPLRTLRRYGFDTEHFSFESGRRCQTGPGIYAFRCRRSEQLFNLVQHRIQNRNLWENEGSASGNSGSNRDSGYLVHGTLPWCSTRTRFSSQTGVTRLSSVGSASGSVGPLSPQSVMSATLPFDTVPLIPPPPGKLPCQNLNAYANEDVMAGVTQNVEETNNNKTLEEPTSPANGHLYLNTGVVKFFPNGDLNNPTFENHNMLPEEISSSNFDNKHLYMNVIPGTDNITPHFPTIESQPSPNFVTLNPENDEEPSYANFDAEGSLPQRLSNLTSPVTPTGTPIGVNGLNYIVLDLKPSGDSPNSPASSLPPEKPRKPETTGGYAAIDFNKTVALSNSINPKFDTDDESSRKTRHSSNINLPTNERHSSSVSE